MRKRTEARTHRPKFFSEYGSGSSRRMLHESISSGRLFSRGNGLVLALEVTENKKKEM